VSPHRAVLTVGLFIALLSGWMVIMNGPGSGAFIASLISLASGALLVVVAIMLARRSVRRAPNKED
jgi:hypothetical protein